MASFTAAQIAQLLRPINPDRVLNDGKGHAHVSQQDVTAHLIRIFGFGSFDIEVDGPHLVFEAERVRDGKPSGRWDVCYRAKATLTIRNPDGEVVCRYQGSATDTAENQKRGDAHDLAIKSAESTAKKRAATHLGDQFGLSLYNKGQVKPLVVGTMVSPLAGEEDGQGGRDMQDGVPKQVSLGHDEDDRDPPEATTPQDAQPQPRTDRQWMDDIERRIAAAGSEQELASLASEVDAKARAGRCERVDYDDLSRTLNDRLAALAAPSNPRTADNRFYREPAPQQGQPAAGQGGYEEQINSARSADELGQIKAAVMADFKAQKFDPTTGNKLLAAIRRRAGELDEVAA